MGIQYNLRQGYRNVNIFQNLMSSEPYVTPMEKIMEITRTSPLLERYTMDAAAHYNAGRRREYKEIKRTMFPAFAPAGILSGGKARKNLRGLTGLCFLDVDHIKIGRVEAAMEALQCNPSVLFAARSLSGNGLHIFVPYSVEGSDSGEMHAITGKEINSEYGVIAALIGGHFNRLLGLSFDPQCYNAERLCVVSYDAKAITNLNAVPVRIRYD